jgi:molybdate transport system substrate-binding protein
MTNLRKQCSLSLSMALLSMLLLTPAVWAQPPDDKCALVPPDATDPVTLTIAVASNFFDPAQGVAQRYINDVDPDAVINVCSNASGILVREINGGNPAEYTLFLAANATFPDDITVPTSGGSFPYVKGIPVLWSNSITEAAMLQSAAVPGGFQINPANVTSLVIANPADAPYGAAAQTILTAINQWYVSPATPPWRQDVEANVDLAYQDILNVTDVAGFVSKAQICPNLPLPPTTGYHDFGSTYYFNQNGILINPGGGASADPVAQAYKDFLLQTDTQDYLITDWCYASTIRTADQAAASKAASTKAPAKKK